MSLPSQRSGKRSVALWASVIGCVICPFTLFIPVERWVSGGREIDVLNVYYGWPFFMASAHPVEAPTSLGGILANVAFWLLAPQALVLLYEHNRQAKT
jgi:hypothetical protein